MTDFAVWSDFRGVVTPPLTEGVRAFCAGREFTPAQLGECLRAIGRRYGLRDGIAVLDSGTLDERRWTREIERELAGRYGVHADLSNFGADWWSDRRVDPDWAAAVRSWRRKGIFVGLMSNMPVEWKPGFAAFADFGDFAGLFDDVVLSCDVGARKPEPGIFREAESRSGLPPWRNVLADDLTDTVAGARRAGWAGVVVDGGGTAIPTVESILRTSTSRGGAVR